MAECVTADLCYSERREVWGASAKETTTRRMIKLRAKTQGRVDSSFVSRARETDLAMVRNASAEMTGGDGYMTSTPR
jgi:hypothetical protein